MKKHLTAFIAALVLAMGLVPCIAFASYTDNDSNLIPNDVYYGPNSKITASHAVDTWLSSGNRVKFCVYYDDGSGNESLIGEKEYETGVDYGEVKNYTFVAVGVGTYRVTFGHMTYDNTWGYWKYDGAIWEDTCIVKAARAANPMSAKAKTVSLKAFKLKSKAGSVKAKKAFSVKNAKGKVSYTVVKNITKNAMKKIKVASNGKVTVKKGTKKGTYKLKVKITAAGNDSYEPASKVVKLVVKVK